MKVVRFVTTKLAVIDTAREVHQKTGKSVLSQLREIAELRRGPGEISATDYYGYRLYDDAHYTPAQKREFIAWFHPRRVYEALNDPHWRAACEDKLLFYALLKAFGYPHPRVHALFHPGGRISGSAPTLRTPTEMAEFLRTGMPYPFFAKPVAEMLGRGASAVVGWDRQSDRLCLPHGEEIGVEEYVEKHVAPHSEGYLFQERVSQHPFVQKICGESIATIRMVVLLYPEGPKLFRAAWRIPVGKNITDNFVKGKTGNVKASVDPRTGVVAHAHRGAGADSARKIPLDSPIERHPDTNEPVTGITLPDWEAAVSTCLTAAASFPGVKYQSWDVAMSETGPVLLELNYNGDLLLTQTPGSAGFNDAEFQAFLVRYGKKN